MIARQAASALLPFAGCLFAASLAHGQILLRPEAAAKIGEALDGDLDGKKLDCEIVRTKPFLDYAFRFEAGFVIRCPVRIFDGKATEIAAYARVTSPSGESIVVGDRFTTPGMPEDMRPRTNIRKLTNDFEMSGGFALGEGEFIVDVLLVDSRDRFAKSRWKVKAARTHAEELVPLTMSAGAAGQLSPHPWEGKLAEKGRGVRLTVLLNAAPQNPYSTRLRVWDRMFLLDSVSSVLRQVPCESVKLVAFNLDQQRVIFEKERFDRTGFRQLGRALRELELGTVSYSVLKRQSGWAELLTNLANVEVKAESPSDIVMFLGPVTRRTEKVPAFGLERSSGRAPWFFDLEYYPVSMTGGEFPDTIVHLTAAENGTVVKIHSPGDLARGIQRMLDRINLQ